MLKGQFRALSIALMITVILVSAFIVFVSSSTGLIRVNSQTASSSGQTVEAGGDINLYFGDVTWSGTQLYLLMSTDSNPQASTGDVFYTPAILVEDVTGTNSHSYSNEMGNWLVGNNWINGSIAPTIPVGAYKIKAFDSLGENTAITDVFITVNMQVSQATLQISPLGGPGGIEVTLTGTGYGAYSLVTLSYYDSEVDSWMFLGTTPASAAGQITFTTEVPDLRKAQRMGDYSETYTQISFRAEVGGIVYSYADYNQYARGIKQIGTQIASGLYGNGTDLSSTLNVEPGDSITISGKWFHPGVVYIRWDGNVVVGTVTSTQWSSAVIVGNAVADQTGYFSTTITIPTSSAGDHYIAIEDSESRVLIKVFMERGSLAISPAAGPGGIPATFSGSNYPASTQITIEYYDPTHSTWNFLGTTTSDSAGQITFSSEIPDLRKTVWSGDSSETTNTLSFRTQSSGIFYSYGDYTQYARGIKRVEDQIANGLYGNGTNLSSKVVLAPEDEVIIAGEWFHPGVVYVRWDGTEVVGTVTSSEWAQATIIATGVASQTGYFEITATIPEANEGVHYISVEDSETFVILQVYLENDQSVNVIEYDDEYVFSVKSNSTISALTFNSTENALSFNAEGVTGTQGYAKVTIAKTLVVNPAEMLVLLDGNQIEYTLEETLESWIVTITYSHSTHKITIALDTSVIPEFSSAILLSLAISASMVMVAVYRKRLNKK